MLLVELGEDASLQQALYVVREDGGVERVAGQEPYHVALVDLYRLKSTRKQYIVSFSWIYNVHIIYETKY